jgi:hypothetical protein
MAQHVLSLETPDTLNKCILRIIDTSVYTNTNTPSCQLLQITVPGFAVPVQFDASDIQPGFSLNLTGCDLELQTTECGSSFVDLPDGVYILRYSVSPNDYVFAEYNHLRITEALNIIQCIYCDLDISNCDPPVKTKEKLNQLTLIRRYLDAAKAYVEFCHQPQKGMELYRYAVKLLDKMTCNTSCSGTNSCSSC